jgi:YidC/Oxa1 family membrane protein insertase
MFRAFFELFFFQPLYNTLVYLTSIVPFQDVGIAIITLTVIVKLILFPLYQKSLKTQAKIKLLEPKIKEIKEKYKDKREEQARLTMELYKTENINPFAGFLVILIQLPIILALFFVFRETVSAHPDLLYNFVTLPEVYRIEFLGLIDMTSRSILLAVLAGVTQFFQMKLALPPTPARRKGAQPDFKSDLARSMNLQMRYVMPVMIGFFALTFPAALALYWTTSNVFAIGQELFVRKQMKKER